MTADEMLARVARRAVVMSAVAAALALVAGGLNAAAGVVGGAALALMSFLMLKRGMTRVADRAAGQGARGAGLGLVLVRYALLALAAYVMIARLRLHPIGLLVGASSVPAAAFVEAARLLVKRTL